MTVTELDRCSKCPCILRMQTHTIAS